MKTDTIFILVCSGIVLTMLIYYLRRKKRISSFLFGSATGLAALILLDKYGMMIGSDVPFNIFNICGSMILGVPFVVLLAVFG